MEDNQERKRKGEGEEDGSQIKKHHSIQDFTKCIAVFVTDKYDLELAITGDESSLLQKYCAIVETGVEKEGDLHLVIPFMSHEQLGVVLDYLKFFEDNNTEKLSECISDISSSDDFILSVQYLGLQDEVVASMKKSFLDQNNNNSNSKPTARDDLRERFLEFTRNQNYPPSMLPEDLSPPPPPPPINTKQHVEGYYEYNEDITFD